MSIDEALDSALGRSSSDSAPKSEMSPRRMSIVTKCAIVWLGLVALLALLADVLPLADPEDTLAGRPLTGFSSTNWLGTDQIGRDLLSRTIFGARVSLVVGIAAVLVSSVVGGLIGLLSGYLRGRVDRITTFLVDVLLAFPALLLAVSVVAFTDSRGPATVIGAIALISLGPTVRIVRGLTMTVSQREFVLASRALGARSMRIVLRELLPNVLPSIYALAVVAVAGAMVAEGGLAYLNLSVAPPTPTWGGMMASGILKLDRSLLPALVPAGAMFLTVLSLALVGDHVQQMNARTQAL